MEDILTNLPDGVLTQRETLKLGRMYRKEKARKVKEIFQYELSKFALGETKDLYTAKRNAESLGKWAREIEEAEKTKVQMFQQKMQTRSLEQQYQEYLAAKQNYANTYTTNSIQPSSLQNMPKA